MKFNKEAKQAFFDAFLTYRSAGDTFVGAYGKACADFTGAHKLAPNLQTFRRWYKDAMSGRKTEEPAAPADETPSAPTEAAEDEEIQPADDYTRRLELICRLYRTHSEESRDALCDYLLPDLCAAAGEEEADDE